MSILLVMSDEVEAELAAHLLSLLGQQVRTAGSLAEARRALAERSWSAVILDTVVDGESGFDLLQAMAGMSFAGGILVLSASQSSADKVRALEEGADDYVVRPYHAAEFLGRVKALLRRARRERGTVGCHLVRVGEVELDVNALVVALPGNRRVRLAPNEMRLLHYLMVHAQRVVERQELLSHLFADGYEAGVPASPNAIDVYVRRVRRKIESDVERPHYIVTVRGRGYQFQERAGESAASCT
jgi:DNA-binding response OmpR family regulator